MVGQGMRIVAAETLAAAAAVRALWARPPQTTKQSAVLGATELQVPSLARQLPALVVVAGEREPVMVLVVLVELAVVVLVVVLQPLLRAHLTAVAVAVVVATTTEWGQQAARGW
ncbi:hypothetical protein HY573_00335 [Candidatus Parcubacteria bacterium]|nr:hypothetical protein [Candidatus Parcubacteria bacterium]